MRVCSVFVQRPGSQVEGRPHRQIVDDRDPHVRVGLQTECQYGNTNKEDRDNSHSLHSKDFQSNKDWGIWEGFVALKFDKNKYKVRYALLKGLHSPRPSGFSPDMNILISVYKLIINEY